MAERSTVVLRITGRVQGVGYRAWAVHTALGLGLAGWVRNLADGSVEALASGHPDAIQQFAEDCRDGPRFANVTAVGLTPLASDHPKAKGLGGGFKQMPTADQPVDQNES